MTGHAWRLIAAAAALAGWWQVTLQAPDWPPLYAAAGVALPLSAAITAYVVSPRSATVGVPVALAALTTGWWVVANYALTPPMVWLERPAAVVAVAAVIGLAAWTFTAGNQRPTRRGVRPLRSALAESGVRALAMPEPGAPDPVRLSRSKRVGLGELTTVTLPPGVVSSEMLGRAEKIAGPLDRQEADVIIEAGRSAREVTVWVGDKGSGSAQAGVWPGCAQDITHRSAFDPIDIGLDRYGQPVTVTLHGGSGMLIGSMPGYGKSSLMNLVVASVVADARARLFVVDCKGGADFTAWENVAARSYSGAPERDPEALLDVLRAAHADMEAKYALLPSHRASKVTDALAGEPGLEPLLVVVDEAQELYGKRSPTPQPVRDEALSLTLSIIARGRAVNVWMLFAGQRVTDDEIPAAITQRVTARVAFRLGTQPASQAVLGPDAWAEGYRATKLPAPGVGYVADETGVHHLRAWFVPDDDAYRLAQIIEQRRADTAVDAAEPTPVWSEEDTKVLAAIGAGETPEGWTLEAAAREAADAQQRAEQERILAELRAAEAAALDARRGPAGAAANALSGDVVASLAADIERVWPTGRYGRLAAVWVSVLADTAGVDREWLEQALADAGAPVERVRMRAEDGTRPWGPGLEWQAFCEWLEARAEA